MHRYDPGLSQHGANMQPVNGIPYSLFTGSLFLQYPLRPGRLLRCTDIVEPFGDICYSSVHYSTFILLAPGRQKTAHSYSFPEFVSY